MSVDREFKSVLVDRFESWELAEFLGISTEAFVEMFEEEIEMNYEELAEWIGLRQDRDSSEFNDKGDEF